MFAGGDRDRRRGGEPRHRQPGGCRMAEPGARPVQRLDVHQLVVEREAGVVEIGVAGAAGEDRRTAVRELAGEAVLEFGARPEGDLPARAVGDPRRVVVFVAADVPRRSRGADEAVAAGVVRAAQQPEFREPGDVRQVPRRRLDAGVVGHAPLRVVEIERRRERRRARSRQRGDELLAIEGAGGGGGHVATIAIDPPSDSADWRGTVRAPA